MGYATKVVPQDSSGIPTPLLARAVLTTALLATIMVFASAAMLQRTLDNSVTPLLDAIPFLGIMKAE